jgi:ABC-2 type transport system ATP-binding protein
MLYTLCIIHSSRNSRIVFVNLHGCLKGVLKLNDQIVLNVDGLIKRYGETEAVRGISFSVRGGEIYGLLGPNGAGKTTTLECIEGLRTQTAGQITVAGFDPKRGGRNFRRALGVQLQSSALPEAIRVGEALALICSYQGTRFRADLAESFGLGGLLKKQYRTLSTGQKRRLNLALVLVSSPTFVILDEPTAGLDVEGRASLHKVIRQLKESGVSVLLATHDMAEAEELCDRIAIVIKGKIATEGTPANITSAAGTRSNIAIRTANGCLTQKGEQSGDDYIRYVTDDTADFLTKLLQKVKDAGDTICDLRVERPTLEECFLEIVKGGKSA